MDQQYAKYLLQKTREDYNKIAEDYTKTRQFVWDIESLVKYVREGDRILDLGCGNGRLLKVLGNKNIDYIGVDQSENLIAIAKRDYPEKKFQTADVFNLPFPDNYFDKIFSIRAFHHIPSEEFRLRFLQEARRILRPGGVLILSVWNAWAWQDKQNLWRVARVGFLKIIGKSKLDFGDALVPWGKETSRYYHFFTKNGLGDLARKSGFRVRESRNICRPPAIIKTLGSRHCDILLVAEK